MGYSNSSPQFSPQMRAEKYEISESYPVIPKSRLRHFSFNIQHVSLLLSL